MCSAQDPIHVPYAHSRSLSVGTFAIFGIKNVRSIKYRNIARFTLVTLFIFLLTTFSSSDKVSSILVAEGRNFSSGGG